MSSETTREQVEPSLPSDATVQRLGAFRLKGKAPKRAAAAARADVIVIGSHKVNPKRRGMGWGTTSYKVGILCRCPILLVK